MSESEAQGTEEAAPHIFLFLSVTFTIGVIIKNLMANTKIPYTVVIFVLGILTGVGGTYSPAFREYLVIDTIPPIFIFYIFFPILIFEGSFDWEIKVFREVFFQTIILALPGLVIATAITAVICKYVMYPGWGWTTALLYGSIISATDPVATVSMMKQLGVSKYIVGMIDGEALLNDGSAIVIYAILLPSVVSGSTDALSVGSVVVSFLRLVFGAVTLGVVMGFALVLFLEHMHREAPLKATITLFVSVLVFYIADYAAKFSGVLALVSCGLVLSYFRYSVRPEEAHVLHAFWEILVYMANTLIFALVGLLIGIEAFTNVKAADVGKLFVLYATIHVSRAVVLILAWPLLNLKASTSWKTILFSTMTGLRGAVGLTLALAINQNNEIDADVRAQFLFLTAGIVILTIVVNGLGGLLLVDVLKLDRKSPERKLIMNLSWRAIQKGLTNHIALSKTMPGMEAANWGIVRHSTSDVFRDPYSGLEPIPYLMHSDRVRILHRAYVRRLLNNARVRFEKGLLTSRSFASYRYELEHVMHQNNVVSFDENIRCLWAICSFSFPFDTAVKTLLTRILRRVPQFMSTLHCREFEICLAYYHGLESLLLDFPIHLDAGIESRLLQIAQEELDRVGQHLRWIQNRSDGSGDLDHMSTQLVCNQVLHRAQTRLKELEDLGFLPPEDINVIAEELEHLLEKIASSRNIQTSSARAFFNLEMVRTLDPEKKSKLFEHVTERVVRKSCCCETDECSEVAIVSTGLIQIRSFEADMQHTHGEGYVLNWGKKDAPDATAVAITEVTLFIIPKEVLQSFAQENVDVDTALWVQVGIQSALHLLSSISPFSSMAPLRRDEVCCHGFLFECSAGTWTMNTSCAGYLLLRGGEHADDAGHQVSTCNVVLSPIHLTNTVTSPTGSGKPNSLRDGTILATNRVSSNTDTVAGHHLQITLTDETLIFVVPVPASEAGLDDLHHGSSTFIVFKSQSTNEEKLEYSVRGEHEIALQIPSVEKRRAGVRRVHSVIRQKFSKLEWPQRNEKEKENEVNTPLIDTQKAPSDTTTSRHEDEKEA